MVPVPGTNRARLLPRDGTLQELTPLRIDLFVAPWPFANNFLGGVVNVHFMNPALFPFFTKRSRDVEATICSYRTPDIFGTPSNVILTFSFTKNERLDLVTPTPWSLKWLENANLMQATVKAQLQSLLRSVFVTMPTTQACVGIICRTAEYIRGHYRGG